MRTLNLRRGCLGLSLMMLGVLLAGWLLPGCGVGYLMTQGYYQGKLLAGREDVQEVLSRDTLSPRDREALARALDIRTFGEKQLGLSPTQNYTTVNLRWSHEIWNVSGCQELAFKAHTWWFPIVGTIPYMGYFREADARAEVARLQAKGYETNLRKAGAYSTLGYFKDPILPYMLTLKELELANMILHELAHATLFISGQVDFNESFASFVGYEAGIRYVQARHGQDSPEVAQARALARDRELGDAYLHAQVKRLETLYQSDQSVSEKRQAKVRILAEIGQGWAQIPFETERYRKRQPGKMNNADLMQFRRYNAAKAQFAAVLKARGEELPAFLDTFRAVAAGSEPPFQALERLAREAGYRPTEEASSLPSPAPAPSSLP